MRTKAFLIHIFLVSFLFSEPLRNGYRLDVYEQSPTSIVLSVEINEQYDWSESDTTITLFFGIPKNSNFKVTLLNYRPFFPESQEIFAAYEAGIMHGLRIGVIDIFPLTKSGMLSNLVFELRFSSPYSDDDKCCSLPFWRIYKAFLVNPPPIGEIKKAGRYLIISGPPFIYAANLLAEWKRKLGFEVKVVTTSTTGTSPSSILNFISTEYRNPQTKPDFVLLYGDVQFPTGSLPDYGYSSYTSDYPYSLLEGGDIFPDVLIGRLSVDTQPEALTIASKAINYEKSPLSSGSGDWLVRGVGVATYVHAISAVTSVMWVRECLLRHNFTSVDTFFYNWATIPPSMIAASINAGAHYVDYRGWAGSNGWWEPSFDISNVLSLNNTGKTPIVTSIVCGTGEYDDSYTDPTFAEAWLRVGTPTAVRGGVAFFGTTDHSTHTRYNNPINEGFYFGAFELGLETLGEAVLAGKMELYSRMISERTTTVVKYFNTYNLLGDPGLMIRTGLPDSFHIDAPSYIGNGGGTIEISVRSGSTGEKVSGAYVSFYSSLDSLGIFSFSDENGIATMFIPSLRADTVFLTISKRDFIPAVVKLPVVSSAPIIEARNVFVNDGFPGNFNGKLEPGEGARISLILNSSAHIRGPLFILDSPFQAVDFDSSIIRLPELINGDNGIVFTVTGKCGLPKEGVPILIKLITTDGMEIFERINIPSGGSLLSISNLVVADTISGSDGDGVLEPGESALLWVELANNSFFTYETLVVSYSVRNGFVAVHNYEPLKFLSLERNGGRRISSIPIKLTLSHFIVVGSTIEIVFWTNLNGYEENIGSYFLTVPPVGSYYPVGPDKYGYICLTDMLSGLYPDAPSYSWVEISSALGGPGTLILSTDDTVEVIPLPFPLKFYGNTYNRLSLSSNGWVAPDSVPPFLFQFYNLPIPHPGGPWGIIAPFWDDLSPHIGGVHYYYDASHRRVIFEWNNVPHASTGASQTFELIIYDSEFYPTTTGDCEIVFQYRNINDTDTEENFSTVGIASPTLLDGIQYLYSRNYAPGAATLQSGRALKFTTNLPLCNVKGRVSLSDRPEGIKAKISLPGGPETFTNDDGTYTLRMLPPDTVLLIASMEGYFKAETVLALLPYHTIDNVNFELKKIPTPNFLMVSKGDTTITVNWGYPEDLAPDSVRIYRSSILGGSPKNISTLPAYTYSFVDITAQRGIKYYYYASLIFGTDESNLTQPDSGWIGSTYAPDEKLFPETLSFEIYPNPFNSSLVISFAKPFDGELVVHNVVGQLVMREKISKKPKIMLEFSNLSSGVYFITMKKDNKPLGTRKALLLK